jgi:hypothetical protein
LALTIQITEIPHADLRIKLDAVIRECIGTRSDWEEWKVLVDGPRSAAFGYCWVVVEAPGQKRQRVFYAEGDKLIEEVRVWLTLYPFR